MTMSAKMSQQQFLDKLSERNLQVPNSQVYLDPPDQIYINQTSNLSFRCVFGHKWNTIFSNLYYLKRGCPHCKIINGSIKNEV
jgi:hypothetical protein